MRSVALNKMFGGKGFDERVVQPIPFSGEQVSPDILRSKMGFHRVGFCGLIPALLQERLRNEESLNFKKENAMKKWRCEACGYIHDGDEAPAKCPKCGAPKEQFIQLDEAAAKLVERSRHTNTLHARVVDLARQVEAVCNDGILDELDPGCVDVFTKSRTAAWQMMKLSLTEMQGHMKKGKWG